MIKYRLQCKKGHEFEGWFSDSATYDVQAKRGLISCPDCGSAKVSKALMAPSVSKRTRERDAEQRGEPQGERKTEQQSTRSAEQSRKLAPPSPRQLELQSEMLDLMRKVRRHVEATAENVGPRFAEEARKMHHDETPARGIYGEASLAEAKELIDEGIDVLPLPRLPEDAS